MTQSARNSVKAEYIKRNIRGMSYKAIGFDYGGVIYGAPGFVLMQTMADFLVVPVDTLWAVFFANNHLVNVEKSMNWVELWQHKKIDI